MNIINSKQQILNDLLDHIGKELLIFKNILRE